MIVVTICVGSMMGMLLAFWDWRRLNKSPALAEKPDYKRIERLERELGLVSALSEEQFASEIDRATMLRTPRMEDPLVEFMSSTYERAMQYVILQNKTGYYVNTDPNKSILTEMFKADN